MRHLSRTLVPSVWILGVVHCFCLILVFGLVANSAGVPAAPPELKTLLGHVPEGVARLSAAGVLPPTNRLHLAIGLSLRDPKGLDDFLKKRK